DGRLALVEAVTLLLLDFGEQVLLLLDADNADVTAVDQRGLDVADERVEGTLDVLARLIAEGEHAERRLLLIFPALDDSRALERIHVLGQKLLQVALVETGAHGLVIQPFDVLPAHRPRSPTSHRT